MPVSVSRKRHAERSGQPQRAQPRSSRAICPARSAELLNLPHQPAQPVLECLDQPEPAPSELDRQCQRESFVCSLRPSREVGPLDMAAVLPPLSIGLKAPPAVAGPRAQSEPQQPDRHPLRHYDIRWRREPIRTEERQPTRTSELNIFSPSNLRNEAREQAAHLRARFRPDNSNSIAFA